MEKAEIQKREETERFYRERIAKRRAERQADDAAAAAAEAAERKRTAQRWLHDYTRTNSGKAIDHVIEAVNRLPEWQKAGQIVKRAGCSVDYGASDRKGKHVIFVRLYSSEIDRLSRAKWFSEVLVPIKETTPQIRRLRCEPIELYAEALRKVLTVENQPEAESAPAPEAKTAAKTETAPKPKAKAWTAAPARTSARRKNA